MSVVYTCLVYMCTGTPRLHEQKEYITTQLYAASSKPVLAFSTFSNGVCPWGQVLTTGPIHEVTLVF